MFDRLLIPLDGSEVAEHVFPYAEEIAANCGSEIMLVSVSDSSLGDSRRLFIPYLESAAKRLKEELQAWGSQATEIKINALKGNPAEELLNCADHCGSDLIVMSSRGASKGTFAVGKIAWKVLEAAVQPVLLIRNPVKQESMEQKRIVRKIQMPLDGSEAGGAMVPYVETLAQRLNAEVVLFHIMETPTTGVLAPGIEMAYRTTTMDIEKNVHLKYLDSIEQRLQKSGLTASTEVKMGPPTEEILRYAQDNNIDLIAISSHGRSGLGRWVFGSVTHKLLQNGETPVLTMRVKRGLI